MNKIARDKYVKRLILPETPKESIKFFTKSGTLVANDYERVVIGDRGPYIEFQDSQIVKENISIPPDQSWRLLPKYSYCYYWEYRTSDEAFVKLYFQKREVDYADYKIDMWYISPFHLASDVYPILIEELKKE
jgi:hypothetical protein